MGLDLGLEQAGMRTISVCESDKNAQNTIRANRPDVPLFPDISQVTVADVYRATGLRKTAQIDVVAGGPPCQTFSTAGTRLGLGDVRGNLLLTYVRLVTELRPRYVVLENVRGLLSAKADNKPGGVLDLVFNMFQQAGYSVSFNLYDAAYFGAPQNRDRFVLIGTLEDTPVPFLNPTHSNRDTDDLPAWLTFKDATRGLPDWGHVFVPIPEKRLPYYRLVGEGENWRNLPPDVQPVALGGAYFSGGGRTGFYRRLAWHKPSPTLLTSPIMPATSLVHPTEDRPLSVQEYARVQGFPDRWLFEGPVMSQYRQIGNSVPVPLGYAIGRAVLNHANGTPTEPPVGFKFSRYKNTSHETWSR